MQTISKVLLLLAALDGAATSAIALASPSILFHFLQIAPNDDGLLLCRLLGFLYLVQAFFLVQVVRQPAIYGGLTLAPLIGRTLSCGVWLWLLGSTRTTADHAALLALLAHDAVWLPIFGGALGLSLWNRRGNEKAPVFTGAFSKVRERGLEPPRP